MEFFIFDDVRICYNYALTEAEILKLSCIPPIAGDLDGNCRVDFDDFAVLASEWLECNRPKQQDCLN